PAIMPWGQVRAMTTGIAGPTPRCPADVGVAFQRPRRARPAGRIRWRTRRQAPFAVRPDVPRPPLAQDSVLAARCRRLRAGRAGGLADGSGGTDLVRAAGYGL